MALPQHLDGTHRGALELPIKRLRQNAQLRETLDRELMRFGPPPLGSLVSPVVAVHEKETAAQRRLIDTGLVDATNLLIMDMDLCVRCGNCSLACHKIHGQSRLTRHGVHVTRLERPSPRAIQSVLSPAVCMHCQDPECLTGCPTGAIGRFVGGQIDIDARTCIGCGDCATQCPYNAISMVSRKGASAPDVAKSLASKFREFLRLAPDPLPPAVEATDDLMAVKCNLCNGTSINPQGSKKPAYACEESCPTGALARINPQEYFTEIGRIEGLLMRDQTHAIGRNIHRSDPPRRMIQLAGLFLLGIGCSGHNRIRELDSGPTTGGLLNMSGSQGWSPSPRWRDITPETQNLHEAKGRIALLDAGTCLPGSHCWCDDSPAWGNGFGRRVDDRFDDLIRPRGSDRIVWDLLLPGGSASDDQNRRGASVDR